MDSMSGTGLIVLCASLSAFMAGGVYRIRDAHFLNVWSDDEAGMKVPAMTHRRSDIRIFTLVVLVLLGTGCRQNLPTTPSPSTTFNLAGVVVDIVLRPVHDVKVEIMDGPQTR